MATIRRRPATLIILVSALAVVGAVLWSFWAELDQITRAPGQVIPVSRTQVIQSTDGGQIARILVREGDRVKRGQLLMVLDSARVGAGVEEVRARVAALQSTRARVEAELFGKGLAFPAAAMAYPAFVANERSLFAQRRTAYSAQVAALSQQAGLARQELALNQPLLASGDVSQSEVLRMQRAVSDIEAQITNIRNKYIQDLQAEYTKVNESLLTATEQLTQRNVVLSDTELRAPTDGIVKNVRLTTVGGVLRPGDEAMQIVPTGSTLIVEAKVSPSDIAFVRAGQSASVKFDAYDSSVYGSGEGAVTFISPDTQTEQRPNGAGEMTFYRVQLSVDTAPMRPAHPGERIEIQPGMTATAEIKTGESTVFRYLTKPILKTVGESMGER